MWQVDDGDVSAIETAEAAAKHGMIGTHERTAAAAHETAAKRGRTTTHEAEVGIEIAQMRLRPPGTDSPAAPAQVAGL
jgi:hypothetical protein